jgi:hypothetical protein
VAETLTAKTDCGSDLVEAAMLSWIQWMGGLVLADHTRPRGGVDPISWYFGWWQATARRDTRTLCRLKRTTNPLHKLTGRVLIAGDSACIWTPGECVSPSWGEGGSKKRRACE